MPVAMTDPVPHLHGAPVVHEQLAQRGLGHRLVIGMHDVERAPAPVRVDRDAVEPFDRLAGLLDRELRSEDQNDVG